MSRLKRSDLTTWDFAAYLRDVHLRQEAVGTETDRNNDRLGIQSRS